MDVISLRDLKQGDRARIDSFVSESLPAKFYDLGLFPEAVIEIRHIAPFNGPICVKIIENDSLVAIRQAEAKLIIVESI